MVNSVRGWARTQLLKIPSGKTASFPGLARAAAEESECGLPTYIEHLLTALETINEQIALANQELEGLAEEDRVCTQLMSMPGVGPVTAMSFRAALEEPSRFKGAHSVGSYLGLTPGENSSGMKTRRLGITGAGATRVRASLIQAAWSAYRTRPEDPMVRWARHLAEKKPPQVAVTALARKMSGILFAMWRDQATYNPAHQH
jgi:transposase